MDKLKPCPFCGGTQDENGTIDHDERCFVILFMDDLLTGTVSKKEIEKAWNTRAERTCRVDGGYTYGERDELRAWALSCGHEFDWNDEEPPKYCPSCGAKVVKHERD